MSKIKNTSKPCQNKERIKSLPFEHLPEPERDPHVSNTPKFAKFKMNDPFNSPFERSETHLQLKPKISKF